MVKMRETSTVKGPGVEESATSSQGAPARREQRGGKPIRGARTLKI